MTPSNIGIVFGPNCVRKQSKVSENECDVFDPDENQKKIDLVAFLITHYSFIFSVLFHPNSLLNQSKLESTKGC